MDDREHNALGSITISPRPVAIIAAATAAAIPGVAALGATLSETAAKKIGHTSPAQGVDVTRQDGTLEITVRLVVQYGCRIPDVAIRVQQAVKTAVEAMTGYSVRAVHILIQDIDFTRDGAGNRENEDLP